ncbi:MAG: stress response protein nst1 [Clostridia bacterium]|nr:stress response protein nst1 [Clostridia bacterium]
MRNDFEGWYFKHQSAADTVALIPGRAKDTAFVQVITDGASYNVPYDLSLYRRESGAVRVGRSSFSLRRAQIDIRGKGILLSGEVAYHHITSPRGDIMGPFRLLPMECRHGLCSLHHELSGSLILNGREIDFTGGAGYIERDSGRSFPRRYAWVQSTDFPATCCVTLAVAEVPLAGFRFQGVVCAVWYGGAEYRLATYSGAKAVVCTRRHIVLQQGRRRLEVGIPEPCTPLPLLAPANGGMARTIHESPSCPARFRFFDKGRLLFDMESPRASVEFCE